jgi:GTP cyclohydrolase II
MKKILKKILANQIQQHTKKAIYHDQVAVIPGMYTSVNIIQYRDKIEDKNHMVITMMQVQKKPLTKLTIHS